MTELSILAPESPEYDLAVFIGRFQPFHLGHLAVVVAALKRTKRVLLLIGSMGGPRSHRNPWNFPEIVTMIRASLPDDDMQDRIVIAPLADTNYNDTMWIANVQAAVAAVPASPSLSAPAPRISLIGHSKDATSYYLKLFPLWDSIEVKNFRGFSSTSIREHYFVSDDASQADDLGVHIMQRVPAGTRQMLIDFRRRPDFDAIQAEYSFVRDYKCRWDAAPFKPTFVTVDACVEHSGRILLVKRGRFPGLGLWALPGGYIEQDETVINATIRELREETSIKLQINTLKECIVATKVFDDPHRSARGRVITHASLIQLRPSKAGIKVRGRDDATDAQWFEIAKITRDMMFEDHFAIIMNLLGYLDTHT